jgi:hypothetical protein
MSASGRWLVTPECLVDRPQSRRRQFHSLVANMAKKKSALEVVDPSGLTDADWNGINQVKRAYESGGWDAFWSELETLGDDVVLQIKVAAAFFPDEIRTAIKDILVEKGITLEDLRVLLKKSEALETVH